MFWSIPIYDGPYLRVEETLPAVGVVDGRHPGKGRGARLKDVLVAGQGEGGHEVEAVETR